MTRALTDYQWIVLWEIEDRPSSVWRRDGRWFRYLGTRSIEITHQVEVLLDRELLRLMPDDSDYPLDITQAGRDALYARDYFQVIDRFNSKA